MKSLPVFLAIIWAAFAIESASAEVADMVALKGSYKKSGHNTVSIGSTSYHGTSTRLKFNAAISGVPAKLKIFAAVESGGQSVKVNNEFKFTGANRFQGVNLAPGITNNAPFKGHFTATPSSIEFQGKFNVSGTKGTFKGTITRAGSKLTVTYSLYIGNSTEANYLYKYAAKL